MKTSPLDFLFSGLSITFLLFISLVTAFVFSVDSKYGVIFDIVFFLISYGVYTGLFLMFLRRLNPYPEGVFSMDSHEFIYWKLSAVLTDLAEKVLRPFNTVFTQALIYKILGAEVGKSPAFAGTIRDFPLISLGDFCTVGQNSVITAHIISGNKIVLKRIAIGERAVVGINCVVMPGVTMGAGAVLAPGAVATTGTNIPAGELWGGIPARKIKSLDSDSA
ncbi:DapH/DapD/GlmU-related protein [Ectothiorhodospira shaposhnikovii]|uniref:DapH/DapD/GlmU-related protein n=1 Tax=Ectothiorhodospira shaposhnikovii TaxID=1054 RepID=UPI001EE9A1AA|nr:DapH/DapD/GlmU-related protein [Ectothiorhodospira shaposhnikovii]MCG5512180.1 hypothetical protein [Ectothiorhodospira shaposhnikovii]